MAWFCGGYCCDVEKEKAESVRVPTTNVHGECVEFPAGSQLVEVLPKKPHRAVLVGQGAEKRQAALSNVADAPASEDGGDLDDAKSTTAETLNGGASPCSAAPGSRFSGRMTDAARADFGGSWLLTAVDGDIAGFLTDLGFPSRDREAARRSNYGVNRQSQHISQAGDAFVVRNTFNGTVTMSFHVGKGEQESLDQEGKKVVIVPVWDGGGVLSVSSKRPSGETLAQSRRYFEGNSMVIEFQSPKGTIMRRIFQRS